MCGTPLPREGQKKIPKTSTQPHTLFLGVSGFSVKKGKKKFGLKMVQKWPKNDPKMAKNGPKMPKKSRGCPQKSQTSGHTDSRGHWCAVLWGCMRRGGHIARKLTRKAKISTLGGTIMRVAGPCGSILV